MIVMSLKWRLSASLLAADLEVNGFVLHIGLFNGHLARISSVGIESRDA